MININQKNKKIKQNIQKEQDFEAKKQLLADYFEKLEEFFEDSPSDFEKIFPLTHKTDTFDTKSIRSQEIKQELQEEEDPIEEPIEKPRPTSLVLPPINAEIETEYDQ